MSTATLVIAESGLGKSASLRNMPPEDTLLIQSIAKPLPFKNSDWRTDPATAKGNIFVTDNAQDIMLLMNKTKRKRIVIDDFQYILANELMRRYAEHGYGKFSEIGFNGWQLCSTASALAPDVRVYILGHSHLDENGKLKIKTPGKLLDTHSVEGMFTIVLRNIIRDGHYYFATTNSGNDTVKTPMGMFKEELIDNDLNLVDKAICEYYDIKPTNTGVVK